MDSIWLRLLGGLALLDLSLLLVHACVLCRAHVATQLIAAAVFLKLVIFGSYATELPAGIYGCLAKLASAGLETTLPS